MNNGLDVYSDLSERVKYNLPGFPLYVVRGALHQFDRYAAACHWHVDLEFLAVLEGTMEYFVNGETVPIATGSGIFVNSQRLHYGFSTDKTDCSYLVAVVHPVLLGAGTGAGQAYLQEKFGSSTADFVMLKPSVPWQRETLRLMSDMYGEINRNPPNLLRLQSQAAALCAGMGDHLVPNPARRAEDQSWAAVWKMTGFIHHHYDRKITLADMAAAGAVCRSRCCTLFGRHLGQTPTKYMSRYRIRKSCEMLRETNRSISEIAALCGFQSPSYFAYTFRRAMGLVPQAYRKQCQAEQPVMDSDVVGNSQ